VPWIDIWIALNIYHLEAALLGTPCAGRLCNPRLMHDAFQFAAAGRPSLSSVGLYSAALVSFVRKGRSLTQVTVPVGDHARNASQVLPSVLADALPLNWQWLMSLMLAVVSSTPGPSFALAAILAALLGWCSHVSRAASRRFTKMLPLNSTTWSVRAAQAGQPFLRFVVPWQSRPTSESVFSFTSSSFRSSSASTAASQARGGIKHWPQEKRANGRVCAQRRSKRERQRSPHSRHTLVDPLFLVIRVHLDLSPRDPAKPGVGLKPTRVG
jgi:hypothetical protein